MKKRRSTWKWLVSLAAIALPAGFGLYTCSSSPLPAGPALTSPLPSASPPPTMAIYRVPTGIVHRSAASGYRGGSLFKAQDAAISAALIRHPKGDLLIDTGFGRKIDEQFRSMPLPFRMVTHYEKLTPAVDQLEAAGEDLKGLRILLTHAHWDHTSGLADFPGTPVMVTAEERRFVDEGGARTVIARSTPDVDYQTYDFEGGPYLGYEKSHDVYGDVSIVVVPSPGHTPGSVILFVTLPEGKRYAFIGDLAWQREGVLRREERPLIWRLAVDSNEQQVREGLVHLSAIAARFPEMVIVPAHDLRAFAELPELPSPG